ncbi:uncharacterized protein OCT59_002625 [Rhizophagus irregularis]|uniref:uncharacterized protein n=1 Tax=Rhizophagus irregularis TaxID=588596 RepID=UPI0033188332|nr:hypothetical protein OCT59_002625 [Rhizophagus irregularis]
MQSPPFFSEKKALFVSLALLEIPYASDGSNNRKFYCVIHKFLHEYCLGLERKWNYYLDMKIINVILNELDIYKNSCFAFLRLLYLRRGQLIRAYCRALDTVFAATFLGR